MPWGPRTPRPNNTECINSVPNAAAIQQRRRQEQVPRAARPDHSKCTNSVPNAAVKQTKPSAQIVSRTLRPYNKTECTNSALNGAAIQQRQRQLKTPRAPRPDHHKCTTSPKCRGQTTTPSAQIVTRTPRPYNNNEGNNKYPDHRAPTTPSAQIVPRTPRSNNNLNQEPPQIWFLTVEA